MSVLERPVPALSVASESKRRRVRPVVWWAALGVAAAAFQIYLYVAWILSSDFKPVGTGTDPVPHSEKVWAWILQPVFVGAALVAIVYLVRGCRRERRLTFDAKLGLACFSILWLDSIGNYISPQVMMNSYYLNRGSWVENIPGWNSPHGALIPQNLIEASVYAAMIFIVIPACWLMGWIRRTRPTMGNVGLFVWTWLAMGIFIVVLEWPLLILTGFCSWAGTVSQFTLDSGSRYQMSLTPDPIIWGAALTAIAALRFHRNDAGLSPVEAGIDRVKLTGRRRTALSTFAIIGGVNAAQLIYGALWVSLAIWLGPTPKNLPSYLRNGACGPGTNIQCPGPTVSIARFAPGR